ncbi:hypothetical protein E4K10_30420 [Streptomyces sp. T1317-0309]|nr:hypothetical protein E4K10_30420 [Streptomyces sp. T1317-0309]
MTNALKTGSTTGALSKACEEARQIAISARASFQQGTIAYVARLIREALPDASAITVDTDEAELYEIRDANGQPLYRAPFTPASPLDDSAADDIDDLLAQVLPFGGLEDAGWETAAEGLPYMTVRLPHPQARLVQGPRLRRHPFLMLDVRAEFTAGERAFTLDGPHPLHQRETRDRIRAAMANAGYDIPDGTLTVTAHGRLTQGAIAADLAIAVTALAAAGRCDPSSCAPWRSSENSASTAGYCPYPTSTKPSAPPTPAATPPQSSPKTTSATSTSPELGSTASTTCTSR